MNKLKVLTALLFAAVLLPAASTNAEPAPTTDTAALRVVTTIFPIYDWVRTVGGKHVEVRQLLTPGTEAHTYAPKPSDLMALRQADLFIYLHPAMEPWAADLLHGSIHPRLRIMELARDMQLLADEEPDEDEHDHHHGDEVDPHVWLDPIRAIELVQSIASVLGELDPQHQDEYRVNADAYGARLQMLDEYIRASLLSCRRRTIIFAGHHAFRYFADRYDLTFVSPYPHFSPDASPGPRALGALVRAVRETGSTVIFHEELVAPRVAETIARETGTRLEMLHAIHNVSANEQRQGATYLSLMEANVQKLKEALDCP